MDKSVYGDNFLEWVDLNLYDEEGQNFALTSKHGTIMYGFDYENGGFFSSVTTEPHFLEFAPNVFFTHQSMEVAKSNALKLAAKWQS